MDYVVDVPMYLGWKSFKYRKKSFPAIVIKKKSENWKRNS